MRNYLASLSPRHFAVMALAMLLVLGGVTAAFADDDPQPAARKEESASAEAMASGSGSTTTMRSHGRVRVAGCDGVGRPRRGR